MSDLLKAFDVPNNPNIPELWAGDAVSVHVRLKEGKNQRIQVYKGTVIRVHRGGNNATFTVRRIASNGIGVERTFLAHSPLVEKVEVHKSSYVRRSRLYYLRERSGKSARLKQKFAK
ncbi:MAG: 50S ribosomal protein L19 [Chloroflexota bacterium]|nr:MAG: 50S ribosomal protein L19 [Chloroflexota bacterium]